MLASAADCTGAASLTRKRKIDGSNGGEDEEEAMGFASKVLPPQGIQSVIADYMRFMKDFAFDNLQKSWGPAFSPENVTWALSVPAAWTEASKSKMRAAAVEAGIVEATDSRHAVFLQI